MAEANDLGYCVRSGMTKGNLTAIIKSTKMQCGVLNVFQILKPLSKIKAFNGIKPST